jgi:hypothetical protein
MDIVIKTLEIRFPLLVSGTILTIVSAVICIVLAMILGVVSWESWQASVGSPTSL